jgi:type I restriction enzyme S subunit
MKGRNPLVGRVVEPLRELVSTKGPRVNPREANGLPFLGMDQVESQTMRLLGTIPALHVRSAAVRFEPGDVLYGRLRPYLNKVCRPDFAGLGSAEFLVLTPSQRLDGDYLSYVLNSADFVRFASRLNTGDRPRVDFKQIGEYPVPLPGRSDQEQIVRFVQQQFSRLHAAQTDLRRGLNSIGVLRRSVAVAATSGGLVPREMELGGQHETADDFVQRVSGALASQGRRRRQQRHGVLPTTPLPKGWIWARLTELGDLDRGKSRHRPRNDPSLYGGQYPFVQTGDIRRSKGTIRQHSQTYNEAGLAQSRLWPTGTLCITIAANIAETAVLSYPACFPDSVAGFVHHGDLATTRYVQVCLLAMKQRLWELAPATAQKNINLGTLDAIAIPLPPPNEQARIIAEVDRIMSLAEAFEAEAAAALTRSRQLRGSILSSVLRSHLEDAS